MTLPSARDAAALRRCSSANTAGTKNSVATVASDNPPMTARPSGAFCSPPSPNPSAIGTMPMIIASAVISTGRNRPKPASSAASSAERPSSSWSLAKLTTRMLLAVATPMHIMAPVSAGTLSVVCERKSIQTMPASAAGSAEMMMKGSSQDWKFTTINRYTRMIASASPASRPMNDVRIVSIVPLTTICEPRGRSFFAASTIGRMSSATPPRSRPWTDPKMSMTGCTL